MNLLSKTKIRDTSRFYKSVIPIAIYTADVIKNKGKVSVGTVIMFM